MDRRSASVSKRNAGEATPGISSMSCKEMGRVLEKLRLPPREKLVALALANYHNDELGKAWPSQATLCAVTGLSRSSIDRAVRDLKKLGIITVTKEQGEKAKYAHNVYRFNRASPGDMENFYAPNSMKTMCQKQPEPCVLETHNPLSTLTDPLDSKTEFCSSKEERQKMPKPSGPPKTPKDFLALSYFQRMHFARNHPSLMHSLRAKGLQYEQRFDRPDGYLPHRFKT